MAWLAAGQAQHSGEGDEVIRLSLHQNFLALCPIMNISTLRQSYQVTRVQNSLIYQGLELVFAKT